MTWIGIYQLKNKKDQKMCVCTLYIVPFLVYFKLGHPCKSRLLTFAIKIITFVNIHTKRPLSAATPRRVLIVRIYIIKKPYTSAKETCVKQMVFKRFNILSHVSSFSTRSFCPIRRCMLLDYLENPAAWGVNCCHLQKWYFATVIINVWVIWSSPCHFSWRIQYPVVNMVTSTMMTAYFPAHVKDQLNMEIKKIDLKDTYLPV